MLNILNKRQMDNKISWQSEWIAIKDLKEFEHNPRRMSKDDFARLVRDIEQDGYHHRLIVNQDNTIIGGHSRKKALLEAGYKKDDKIEVLKPNRQLTEEEFKRINVKDNLPFGEFDFDVLGNQFDADDLIDWGMPAEWLLGKDEPEIEELKDEKPDDTIPYVDKQNTITKTGDIWILGNHKIICGDSFQVDVIEKLMQGKKADMCFLDPPYGIKLDEWDDPIDIPYTVHMVETLIKDNAFFAFTMQMLPLVDWLKALEKSSLKFKDHIVWVKRSASAIAQPLLRSHETLMVYKKGKPEYFKTEGKYSDVKIPGIMFDITNIESVKRHFDDLNMAIKRGKRSVNTNLNKGNEVFKSMYGDKNNEISPEDVNFTNVWSFLPENQSNRQGENPDHPTVKPLLLMKRIVELCCKDNEMVLDLFLGSGSTLIACQRSNRICYGVEKSPYYCDIIVKRWEKETGNKAVLEGQND